MSEADGSGGAVYRVGPRWLAVAEPREVVYRVGPRWLAVAEPGGEPLSEAELSLIWQGQRFPPEALSTADGRAVEVVNPGRRGGGSGPDFVDAVVRLDGVERRGDVELHVRASAFRGHGHDADPAYDNLALHVVYEADERETRLRGGGLAPVAAFAPWLAGRTQELRSWLQAPEIWRQPCRDAPRRLGRDAVGAALEEAGARRFQARVRSLRQAVRRLGEEEALWRALLDTLGVGGDREGFRRLAAAFPASLAARLDDPEAALCFVAGLGPPPRGQAALPLPLRPALRWFGRPANRPQRRLAGLAALLRRAVAADEASTGRGGGPLSALAAASLEAVAGTGSAAGGRRSGSARRGGAALEATGGGVGTMSRAVSRLVAAWSAPPQIGPGRARELLVNAVLPLAAARGREEAALALLRRLPAGPPYGRTVFLEANLAPARGRMARNALQSQGLLAYVAEWCSRDGCGRCPLSRPLPPSPPGTRNQEQGTRSEEPGARNQERGIGTRDKG